MLTARRLLSSSIPARRALSSGPTFRGRYGSFIAGEEYLDEGLATFDVENPATGEHICKVEAADAKLVADKRDAKAKNQFFVEG
mgnify:CR=1 FL=1